MSLSEFQNTIVKNPHFARGFTLIEVIISMTILSLVVTVLYFAFSVGVSTWKSQEERSSKLLQFEKVLRLLRQDFASLRPYTFNSEGGSYFFCRGGPQMFFYVTTNGLAAANRALSSMYFSVLFVQEDDTQGQSLYLYKNGLPEESLCSWLKEFSTQASTSAFAFQAEPELFDNSLLLVQGIADPVFVYQSSYQGIFEEQEGDENSSMDTSSSLDEGTTWEQDELPRLVGLKFSNELGTWSVRAPVRLSE